MKRDDPNGIDERSYRFHRDVLRFLDSVPVRANTKKLIEQLSDASGSIGGNREEALGGSTRKEFIRFNEIALRGANESVRWLRTCAARRLGEREECLRLLDEARQEAKILPKIVITAKSRSQADESDSEDSETDETEPQS
jgi:four helix bundle protein